MTKKSNQLSAGGFEKLFPSEEACDVFLIARRWPNGVTCPRCGSTNVYPLQTMKFKWECPDCREGNAYRFSHLVGTIFENSATSLQLWFYALYLMTSTRCGVSAKHLERELGVTYKTAWRMASKIRELLAQESDVFDGTVEVDEMYVGGNRIKTA